MTDLNKLFQDKMGRPMKYRKQLDRKWFDRTIWVMAIVLFVLIALAAVQSS